MRADPVTIAPPVLKPMIDADEATRVRMGANTATSASVFQALASDPSAVVRATLAMNPAAPPHVDRALATDADERVRILLARKLSTLAPSLSGDAQMRLQKQALDTLMALVEDEAVRVRAAIAEEIKGLPDVPRGVILRLAHDNAVMVCEPVIRFSPMLSQQDLLALLASAPSPVTAQAVARRSEIDEAVSDAIAATANSEAIRLLLGNRTAQIREATLDALVAQAMEHADWHAPLVHRPSLPARAARALSEIVATNLLEVLAARGDFDPTLAADLQARLRSRLAQPVPRPARRNGDTDAAAALAEAQERAATGTLTETVVTDALRHGDMTMVIALLAVAAGLPVSVVERAASLRSAKGLLSLAWRAGFTMQTAIGLQAVLGRLAPNAILQPGPGGSFPLTVEEMRWQVDFLGRIGR